MECDELFQIREKKICHYCENEILEEQKEFELECKCLFHLDCLVKYIETNLQLPLH